MKSRFAIIIAFFYACGCFAQTKEFIQLQTTQVKFEKLSFEELKAKAKKEKKSAFVYVNMAWCPPCKQMEHNVLTDFSVSTYYNSNFVNGSYEFSSEDGQKIAEQYQIISAPTYLFIDADGNVLHRGGSYMNPEYFVKMAQDAANPQQRLAHYDSLYPQNKTNPEFLLYYLRMLTNTSNIDFGSTSIDLLLGEPTDNTLKREQVRQEYFETQKEDSLINTANWEAIKDFTYDYKSREFTYLLKHAEKFKKLYGKKDVDAKIKDVLMTGHILFSQGKPNTEVTDIAYINEVKNLNSQETATALFWLSLRNAELSQKWNDYMQLVSEQGSQYIISPAEKEEVSKTIYEDIKEKSALETAESMMKSAVAEAPSWINYETYGNVLYELHKKTEAKIMTQKAIERAKLIGAKKENYNGALYLLEKIEKLN